MGEGMGGGGVGGEEGGGERGNKERRGKGGGKIGEGGEGEEEEEEEDKIKKRKRRIAVLVNLKDAVEETSTEPSSADAGSGSPPSEAAVLGLINDLLDVVRYEGRVKIFAADLKGEYGTGGGGKDAAEWMIRGGRMK